MSPLLLLMTLLMHAREASEKKEKTRYRCAMYACVKCAALPKEHEKQTQKGHERVSRARDQRDPSGLLYASTPTVFSAMCMP